jgi:hypothetical protein
MTTIENQAGPSLPNEPRRFGRYETVRLIGQGAMGKVYLGRDPVLLRDIALKVIAFDPIDDLQKNTHYLDRFISEARASAQLNHPTIVGVYDVGHLEGTPWIAFQYVEGESLAHLLKRAGRLDISQSIRIGLDVASALEHAHGFSILHRDIKPGNILIDAKSGTAKLTDFGIAKAPWSPKTHDGLFIGSPGYASPEQIDGSELDSRSDIFSLGILLYLLITGKHPFCRDTLINTTYAIIKGDYIPIRHLRPEIGRGLEQIITKCLAIRPKDRYASASHLIKALHLAQSEHENKGGFKQASSALMTTAGYLAKSAQAGAVAGTRIIRQQLRTIPWPSLAMGAAKTIRGVAAFIHHLIAMSADAVTVKAKAGPAAPQQLPRRYRNRFMLWGATACGVLLVAVGIHSLATQIDLTKLIPTHLFFHADQPFPEFDQKVSQCRTLILCDSLTAAAAIAAELQDEAPKSPYGSIFLSWIAFKRDDYATAQSHLDAIKNLQQHKSILHDELASMLDDIKATLIRSRAEETLIDLLAHDLGVAKNHTFQKWVSDTRYWLRWNSVKILNAAGINVDMVPVYILDLQHAGSFPTRIAAAKKLGELKDKRAVPALKEVAGSIMMDPFVALQARAILRESFGIEVE